MKHTEGPWVVDSMGEGLYVTAGGAISTTVCRGIHNEADARLIAKGPTMYEYIKRKADEGCEEASAIVSEVA